MCPRAASTHVLQLWPFGTSRGDEDELRPPSTVQPCHHAARCRALGTFAPGVPQGSKKEMLTRACGRLGRDPVDVGFQWRNFQLVVLFQGEKFSTESHLSENWKIFSLVSSFFEYEYSLQESSMEITGISGTLAAFIRLSLEEEETAGQLPKRQLPF